MFFQAVSFTFSFLSLSPPLSSRLTKLTWLFFFFFTCHLFLFAQAIIGQFCFSSLSLTYCSSPWPPLYLPWKLSDQWNATWGLDVIFYLLFSSLSLERGRTPLDLPAALAGIPNHILWVAVNVFPRAVFPVRSRGLLTPGLWLAPPTQWWPWRTARPVSSCSLSWDPQWCGEQLLCSEFPHSPFGHFSSNQGEFRVSEYFLTHLFSLLFLGSGCHGKQV